MVRKKIVLSLLTVLVLLLTACSGNSNVNNTNSTASESTDTTNTENASAKEPVPAKPEKVKLKILAHASWIKGGMEAVVKDVLEKENIELEIEKVAEGEEGQNLMSIRFATNDKPDLILYYPVSSLLIRLGEPADNFVPQEGQPWMQNFNKDAWTGLLDYNGTFYASPVRGANGGVVFYNKKVFEELNIQVPTTYEELLQTAEVIKNAGKVPFYLSGKDSWTLQLIPIIAQTNQGTKALIKNINENKAKFNDMTGFNRGLEILLELKERGYINKSFLSDTYDNAQKAIAEGEAAMYVMGSFFMDEIAKKYPDKINDIGSFVLPIEGNGKDAIALFPPSGLYVVKGAKQDAAQRFVNYFESIETQTLYFSNEGGIPAIQGVEKTSLTPAAEQVKQWIDEGKGFAKYDSLLKYSPGSIPKFIESMMVDGGSTPEEVLEFMEKEFLKNAKANNDPNF